MKNALKLGLRLLIIAAVAGLALGLTNAVTAEPIAANAAVQAAEARQSVFPGAAEFTEAAVIDGVDEAYAALDASGAVLGYTVQVTVNGYGGPIEVIVGMGNDGVVTGINVGGANFSETAGLGARTKEAAFTEQFRGVTPPVVLGDDVDAVTAATISSTAVVKAVNTACDYLVTLIG